jgi:hypothetical protein
LNGERRISELRLPIFDAEAREKFVEVFGPIEVAESIAEDRVEDSIEFCRIIRTAATVGYAHSGNPAGIGQSSERIAITLNS